MQKYRKKCKKVIFFFLNDYKYLEFYGGVFEKVQ